MRRGRRRRRRRDRDRDLLLRCRRRGPRRPRDEARLEPLERELREEERLRDAEVRRLDWPERDAVGEASGSEPGHRSFTYSDMAPLGDAARPASHSDKRLAPHTRREANGPVSFQTRDENRLFLAVAINKLSPEVRLRRADAK